ncbi:PREDICTED: uncharacterized protein LOC107191240 [Dufourea novaeangliae]|uniref:uncharacterized protein LOC107191240 n=1 Tax=Dufourea novaeangliae TaxID=178035 RepID=UPI000767C3A0|nr:PREDICTED: uncharacterized protein LOC107191240 [Dufourea novaeangliae]
MPCLLMKKITSDVPNFHVSRQVLSVPSQLHLADPQFDTPHDIDLLIGNGYLWDIMCVGQHRLGRGLPVLLKTQLGWVFGGRMHGAVESQAQICGLITNDQLNAQFRQFWEIEQVSTTNDANSHPCEDHFVQTVARDRDGRYMVTIPFTDGLRDLGDSFNMAERRFLNIERKLIRSPILRQEYREFMREYERLGHMSKIPRDGHSVANPVYYLPHHAVTKETSTTTKVRTISTHPIASHIIIQDFYVDDLLTGADTIEQARVLKQDVSRLLREAGFELRKWASHEPTVINSVSDEPKDIVSQAEMDPRTLGMLWGPLTDELRIAIKDRITTRVTKRVILSELARIFNPLGLVGPVVIRAKLLMQLLWQLKVSWDESVPQRIHAEFQDFQSDLQSLRRLAIPRLIIGLNSTQVEIHGFCDASEKAYGACVYLRRVDGRGNGTTRLLCAKSRVAPLKTISLPRLELRGALLLMHLVDKVRTASRIVIAREFYWSDSMITLAWLKGSPNQWKTFVANRVTEIQNLSRGTWRHVGSAQNPADLLSRGVRPSALQDLSLWWNGPSWLQQCPTEWPVTGQLPIELPEGRAVVCTVLKGETDTNCSLLTRFSNCARLIRVVAYCLRFCHNIRTRKSHRDASGASKNDQISRSPESFVKLSIRDLELAEDAILKMVQKSAFGQELVDLRLGNVVGTSSTVRCLNPVLDDKGLLRVGGRLSHAELRYEQQHPVIWPKDSPITRAIIRREHERSLHAGCEAVLSAIRRRYWPLAGRSVVKGVLRSCLLQAMYQHFWKRWQQEYLHHLQQRNKWKVNIPDQFGVGTMVVLEEDNLPLLRWKLVRITALHPGADHIIRVVSIQTANGPVKRPATKICVLPLDEEIPASQAEPGGSSDHNATL